MLRHDGVGAETHRQVPQLEHLVAAQASPGPVQLVVIHGESSLRAAQAESTVLPRRLAARTGLVSAYSSPLPEQPSLAALSSRLAAKRYWAVACEGLAARFDLVVSLRKLAVTIRWAMVLYRLVETTHSLILAWEDWEV